MLRRHRRLRQQKTLSRLRQVHPTPAHSLRDRLKIRFNVIAHQTQPEATLPGQRPMTSPRVARRLRQHWHHIIPKTPLVRTRHALHRHFRSRHRTIRSRRRDDHLPILHRHHDPLPIHTRHSRIRRTQSHLLHRPRKPVLHPHRQNPMPRLHPIQCHLLRQQLQLRRPRIHSQTRSNNVVQPSWLHNSPPLHQTSRKLAPL